MLPSGFFLFAANDGRAYYAGARTQVLTDSMNLA